MPSPPESTVAILRADDGLTTHEAKSAAEALVESLGVNSSSAFREGRSIDWHIDNAYYSADVWLEYVDKVDELRRVPAVVALRVIHLLESLDYLPVALVYLVAATNEQESSEDTEMDFGIAGWECIGTNNLEHALMLHTWPGLQLKNSQNPPDSPGGDADAEERLVQIESHLAGKIDGDSLNTYQRHPELERQLEEFLGDDDFGDFVAASTEVNRPVRHDTLPTNLDAQMDAFARVRAEVERIRSMPSGPSKEGAAIELLLSLEKAIPDQQ